MKNKITIIKIVLLCVASVLAITAIVLKYQKSLRDTVKFKGNTYVLLEYNADIFTYNFISNSYYEEDIIYPVPHKKWDIVYLNGDIFVLDKQVDEATKYYKDDKNYDWYLVYESTDNEERKQISISKEEQKYLYNMENIKKEKTTTFDDIKQFVDIVKVSKDGFIQAIINTVNYKDSWYWKTEIMTDNDEEYIIPLPGSLNNKIDGLVN